jgi:hypothetical protein
MSPFIAPRRQFLRGLVSLVICAPAVVHASTLMGVSARFCDSSDLTPQSLAAHPLALLQHEIERRFTETVFGAENLAAETEDCVPTRSLTSEAKITALWEFRTLFGPRGSPPKSLEDLPAEVRAGLSSMFSSRVEANFDAPAVGFAGFAALERGLRI